MKRVKKLLAALLVLTLAVSLMVPVLAADGEKTNFFRETWEKIVAWYEALRCKVLELWFKLFPPPFLPPYPPDDPNIVYKPVIYLYPEQPTEVSVTVQPRGAHFIETIPDYGAGWRVLAQPDGTLTDLADGEQYPYLFWEASLDTPWPQLKDGFVVARADLAGFLREKLAYLGLNQAEADEFIAFWLPKLAGNAYTLIHFEGAYYDGRFPLGISPAPDSLLRVFMVARAASRYERVAPQALVPFERHGFAAVEWGGMVL